MKNFFSFLFCAFLLAGCSEKEYQEWNRPWSDEGGGFSHDAIILGEQLPDPYSVENMTKALASLYPTKAPRTVLDPTHFYVRFLPRDDEQLAILEDCGLELLDHPLDYRIVREGDWYHDPSLPEDCITWQYAVVPVDFAFPRDIRYERLDECYIAPEEDEGGTKAAEGIDWARVEAEAYRLTGNLDSALTKAYDESYTLGGVPHGRISLMDYDRDGAEDGLKGVKVSCNSFVKFASCYTDAEGNYRMSRRFATDPRYRVVFKNIRGFSQGINLIFTTTSISTFGTQSANGFDAQLDCYSDRNLFNRCVVNNAGFDYIEASRESGGKIPAPPKDLRVWHFDFLTGELPSFMHHGVLVDTFDLLEDMPSIYGMLIKVIQPDIFLGLDGNESYADVYRKAIHVFAHAGHFAQAGKDWWWSYLQFAGNSLVASTLTTTYGSRGDAYADWFEVAEDYAFYCQNALCQRRYEDSEELDGMTYWFSPQLLMYLDERGLGLESLAPMFTADVSSLEDLRKKLLSYYPPFKSVINEAYARYVK